MKTPLPASAGTSPCTDEPRNGETQTPQAMKKAINYAITTTITGIVIMALLPFFPQVALGIFLTYTLGSIGYIVVQGVRNAIKSNNF